MERFIINNIDQTRAFFTYEDIINFGLYLRNGIQYYSDDEKAEYNAQLQIFMDVLESSGFSYMDDKLAIFINYGIEDDDDAYIISIYDVQDNSLIYTGGHLDNKLLPELDTYLFEIDIETIADVVKFNMSDVIDYNSLSVITKELMVTDGKVTGTLKDDNSMGMILVSGIPQEMTIEQAMKFRLQENDIVFFMNDGSVESKDDINIHVGIMIDNDYCQLYTTPNRRKQLINSRIKCRDVVMIKQSSTEKVYMLQEDSNYEEFVKNYSQNIFKE